MKQSFTLTIMLALFAFLIAPGLASADQSASATIQDVQATIIDASVTNGPDMAEGRGFAIPGENLFPNTPGYFGEATPGHRFIPLSKLLMFTTVWDVEKARNMLAGHTGRKNSQFRNLLADNETRPVSKVYCTIAKPSDLGGTLVDQIAFGTIAAKNGNSISADVLATAIVEAAENGANYIMFLAEGVNREVDASGIGIGANFTRATLTGSGNSGSNVGSGGMGYSRGWAGYIDYPWLQMTTLSVSGIDNLPVMDAIVELTEIPKRTIDAEER